MAGLMPPRGYTYRVLTILGILWVLVVVVLTLSAPHPLMGSDLTEPYKDARVMLHTLVEIKVYGDNPAGAVNAAFNEIERVNRLLNNYDPESEVSLINKTAGLNEVPVSPETLEALMGAQYYGKLTGGALDITIGPLLELWGFLKETPSLETDRPSSKELDKIRQIVDYNLIRLDAIRGKAMLLKPGMRIDAGSFTKGYAVDRAADLLKKAGIKQALITAGGTIMALGKKPGGKSWQVGIRHPRRQGKLIGSVPLEDQAISTSGDYERFYQFKDRRICHIIDPRSGQPIEAVQSISVITPSAMASDALSTALFVLGPKEGFALVNNLPDTEVLVVDQEGIQHRSRGWPGHQH
jgi:thiamine biosynthesis lipoprotein